MAAVSYLHIELSADGVPFLEGTRTKVVEIALDGIAHHWDAEEIQRQHTHLTLGQMYAALVYDHDHREAFDAMTSRYAGLPNIIYEIANEPNYSGRAGIAPEREVRWADIVAYANEVIPVIRDRSPESLILVGTPDWCSFGMSRGRDWHEVVDSPLDHENVAYVVHAYAAGHTFHAVIDEIAERLPLFVTEWAAATWDRSSANNLVKAQPWIEMFDRRGLSWTYWNFCPGDGVFGCFTQGTSSDDELNPGSPRVSETGKLVYLLLNTPLDRWQAPTTGATAASHKVGVDFRSGGTLRLTSDDFFAQNGERFDLIFIDGLHLYEQVRKDILHSLEVLEDGGKIVLHDCVPTRCIEQYETQVTRNWNGDVWRALVKARTWEGVDIVTCLIDYGLGIVRKRTNGDPLHLPTRDFKTLLFDFLAADYRRFLRTVEWAVFNSEVGDDFFHGQLVF